MTSHTDVQSGAVEFLMKGSSGHISTVFCVLTTHLYDSFNVLKYEFFSQEDNMGFGRPTK